MPVSNLGYGRKDTHVLIENQGTAIEWIDRCQFLCGFCQFDFIVHDRVPDNWRLVMARV